VKEKIEILKLVSKKNLDVGTRRNFVNVKTEKNKVSPRLKRELLKNYGFKVIDN
jgi:hypothetical protein